MPLTYQTATTITSSPTIRGGCTVEATNEALLLDSANSRVRRFSLSTFAETASATCLASPAGIALINSSSAIICSSAGGTVDFFELASNTRSNVAGGITSTTGGVTQVIAGDTVTETVLYVGNGTSIGRVRASGFAVSSITPRTSSSNRGFRCIINIASDRWLVGCSGGALYEIDSNGTVYKQMNLGAIPNVGLYDVVGASMLSAIDISTLYYDNNIIFAASTSGQLYMVDWTSLEVIAREQVPVTSTTYCPVFCSTGSGSVVGNFSNASQNPGTVIWEVDIADRGPVFEVNPLYNANAGSTIIAIDMNKNNGRGWYVQSTSGPIKFFDVTSDRATTTRTFTVNPGGVHQRCNLTLYDETGGTASGRPILDTVMQSPATYRVPTGRDVIELVQIGEGITSSWKVNRYTT